MAAVSARASRRPRGVAGWINATFRHWSLLPAVVLFVALTAYPVVNLLRMSVSTITWKGASDLWELTPRRNFEALWSDPSLGAAVVNTLLFVVVAVAVEMVLGLTLALLVGKMTRGRARCARS